MATFTLDMDLELPSEGASNAGESINDNSQKINDGRTYKWELSENGLETEVFFFDDSGTATKAKADAEATSKGILGFLTADGLLGAERYFRYNGVIEKTSWGLTPNTVYYLSEATAGAITSTKPTSPDYGIEVGKSDSTGDKLYIKIQVPLSVSIGVQNLFETIDSDDGDTTADSPTDTLTIAGGNGVATEVTDDTLTVSLDVLTEDWDGGGIYGITNLASLGVAGEIIATKNYSGETSQIDTFVYNSTVDDSALGSSHWYFNRYTFFLTGTTGTTGQVHGFYVRPNVRMTNDVDYLYGFEVDPYFELGSGNIYRYKDLTTRVGYWDGTTTTTITHWHRLGIDNPHADARVTNLYAVYLAEMTRGTSSNWQVYSAGGNWYFGGGSLDLAGGNIFDSTGVVNIYDALRITQNGDTVDISHDGSDFWMKWSDGSFKMQTDEGTNTNTYFQIRGKGSGYGVQRVYSGDQATYVEFTCIAGFGYLQTTGSSPAHLRLQNTTPQNISMWASVVEGVTKRLHIHGYRTGDIRRSLQIGVGVDAADTASFDGVSNYLFDGVVNAISGFEDNGVAGIDATFLNGDGDTVTVSGGIITSIV